MKPDIARVQESHPVIPTLLGQGPMRIPTGGKIRAGIKVLTKKAADNPTAQAIYDRGVAAGQSFDDIGRAITQAVPDLRAPLIPKNVAWFTVRPGDFPNPAMVGQILDTYGEVRDDGVKRLYRFPVVFPADRWQTVMPHELVTWGANDKKFWSEYAPNGRERYCKCYAPVPLERHGKRAVRVFGGRKTVLRADNGGICNPETCPEYQSRQCNLSGRFLFYIPGIRTIDAFELQTNSFYAMSRAIEQFEALSFLRGGRISGFLDGGHTPFYLTKKLREVPYIDDYGQAVRTAHWIIELEAPIDITALLRANADETALLHGHAAAQVLEGGDAARWLSPVADAPGAPENGLQPTDLIAEESEGRSAAQMPLVLPDEPLLVPAPTLKEPCNPDVAQVLAAALALGADAACFEKYAARRWGAGWKHNAAGRRRVLDEIHRYRNDAEGFVDKIDAALQAPGAVVQEGSRP